MKDFGHLGRPPGWGERLPGDDGGDQHGEDDQRGCGDQHGGGDHDQNGGGQNCCHLGCGRHQDYHCVEHDYMNCQHLKNCRSSRKLIFSPCQQGVGDRL